MPQSTNVMHWSSEARRQAAASALEAKRIASLRQAGSAKVSTLPPKKDINGLMKIQKAHMSAAKMVAACRVSDAGLNDAGSSLVPTSDLALAFGASMDDPMSPAGGEDGDVDVSAISSAINRRPDLAAVGIPTAATTAAAYAIESVAAGGGAVGIAPPPPPPATSTPPSVAAAVAAAAAAAAAAVAALQPSPIPLSYTNPLGENGGGAYDSARGMGVSSAAAAAAYPGVGPRMNFPLPMLPPVPASSPPPPPPPPPPPQVAPPVTTSASRLPGIDLERAANVERAATIAAALATAAKGNPFAARHRRLSTKESVTSAAAVAAAARAGEGGSSGGGSGGAGRAPTPPPAAAAAGVEEGTAARWLEDDAHGSSRGGAANAR
ncbi:unnamed protein product, partial [Ectocarpus fasciculatus]